MARLKKTVTALFAVAFATCLFLGAYFFLSGKRSIAAYADTVTIGAGNASYLLDITDGVLAGFKSGEIPDYEFILEIPDGVTSIAANAFNAINSGKETLRDNMVGVVLPAGLNSAGIGNNAFANLDSLLEVCNKSAAIQLVAGNNTANGGVAYKAVNIFKDGEFSRHSVDGFTFVYNSLVDRWLLVGYEGSDGSPEFHDCVEAYKEYPETAYDIYDYAFYGNDNITSVTIPDGVTSIGQYAFDSCSALEEVVLPESLADIGYSAFARCVNLSSINWNKIMTIGNNAFTGCTSLTKLNLPDTLTSIGQNAFEGCTGVTELTFGENSALETINRYAFSGCTSLGKAVTLPDSLKSIYVRAFYGCSNISFVYIPDGVTFNNLSAGAETGYFANNTVIVFKNLSAYNNGVAQSNLKDYHTNITYLIDIKTFEENAEISGGTTQRLYGYSYNYIRISSGIDKDTWTTDSSLTDTLAVQTGADGYKSTVWYKSAELENASGNVADTAYVNSLLTAVGTEEICIYAHKAVSKPADVSKGWTYDENTYLEVDNVLGYFGTTYTTGMEVSNMTYTDTTGSNPVSVKSIADAGVYSVSVTLDENYGEWISPAVFTVNVDKKAIDLNNAENYGGQFWISNGSALLNATTTTLYIYDGIPYLSRQDLDTEETIKYVKTSYLNFTGDEQVIHVSANGNKYFTVGAESGNKETATGSYTATATITPTNNYGFILLDFTQETAERGHYVVINDNGTATLTKEWYIVRMPNRVLIAGSDSVYSIADWTFGDSSVEIPLPVLEKGNPSDGDYENIFTFRLTKDNVTVGGANTTFRLSAFENYLNWTMPAGTYELQVTVSNVFEGNEAVEGFSTTFTFTVNYAKITVAQADGQRPEYVRSIDDRDNFFVNDLTVGFVGLDEFEEYWQENKTCFWSINKAEYYSENYSFTYNLARMYSSDYYDIDSGEIVNKIGADTFTVYYWLTMKNHEFIDISERYEYYYTVVGYTTLEKPDVESAYYTGSQITPALYDTAEYSVVLPSNIVEAKDYQLTVTLNDAEHYKWSDKDYGVAENAVNFTVEKAENGWFTNINLINWTWNSYEKTTNRFIAAPDFGTAQDVQYRIYDKDYNLIKINGKDYFTLDKDGYVSDDVAKALNAFDAVQYYLLATVTESANWLGINELTDKDSVAANALEFNVAQATNTWLNSPNVIRWIWGEFDKEVNLISAVPAFGENAVFAITTDAAGKTPVKGLEGFTTVNGVVSDKIAEILNGLSTTVSYYLTVSVEGSTNYTELTSYGQEFNVFIMNNYWDEAPEIRGWSEGRYDAVTNAIKASAVSGEVIITITDLDGNVITSGKADEIDKDKLASLAIGEYVLNAKVEGTSNYTALDNSIHFFVIEDSVGMSGIIAAAIVFACFDFICAGFCIALVFIRKKKIEDRFRRMIKSELHKGE